MYLVFFPKEGVCYEKKEHRFCIYPYFYHSWITCRMWWHVVTILSLSLYLHLLRQVITP